MGTDIGGQGERLHGKFEHRRPGVEKNQSTYLDILNLRHGRSGLAWDQYLLQPTPCLGSSERIASPTLMV